MSEQRPTTYGNFISLHTYQHEYYTLYIQYLYAFYLLYPLLYMTHVLTDHRQLLDAVIQAVDAAQRDINTIQDPARRASALYGLVAFSREFDKLCK